MIPNFHLAKCRASLRVAFRAFLCFLQRLYDAASLQICKVCIAFYAYVSITIISRRKDKQCFLNDVIKNP